MVWQPEKAKPQIVMIDANYVKDPSLAGKSGRCCGTIPHRENRNRTGSSTVSMAGSATLPKLGRSSKSSGPTKTLSGPTPAQWHDARGSLLNTPKRHTATHISSLKSVGMFGAGSILTTAFPNHENPTVHYTSIMLLPILYHSNMPMDPETM